MKTLCSFVSLRNPIVAIFVLLCCCSPLASRSQTNCTPAPSGLLAWWPGDGFALDVVGTNNGTLQGGVTFVPGEVGQAFSFAGSHPYVGLPDNCFPFPTTGTSKQPFTFEVWFKTSSGGVLLGQQNAPAYSDATSYVPGLYVGADGKLRAEMFWTGAVSPIASQTTVTNNSFHHAAVTFDGANQILYLDGKPVGTNHALLTAYAAILYYQFGTGYTQSWPGGNGGWYQFGGLIDEPTLYSRALSGTEISAIYTAGSTGKCFPSGPAPVIVEQPISQSGFLGGTLVLSAAAVGAPRPNYQWFVNGVPLNGETSPVLLINNLTTNQAGSYTLVANNLFGSATSAVATITIVPPTTPCTEVLFSEDFENGQLPPGVAVSTVGTFSSSPRIQAITNFAGSKAFGFGLSTCGANCFDSFASTLSITLPSPNYVSELSFEEMELYGNWGSWGGVYIDGVPLDTVQDFGRLPINDHTADTTFRTHAFGIGRTVTNVSLRVTDITDQSEVFVDHIMLTATSTNTPMIAIQPSDLALSEGMTGTFTVLGSSTVPFTYQWLHRGTNLSGATNFSLSLPDVSVQDEGDYKVILANCSGSITSTVATLSITNILMRPTIIVQPASIATNQGATVSFSVAATGTAPLSYQWMFNSNAIATATNSILTLTDVQASQDGVYFVAVSNVVASMNSTNASLLVIGPPVLFITSPSNGASFAGGSNILISASASEANGTIQNVKFFFSTTLLGSVQAPPYALLWSNVPAGTNLELTAVAVDGFGLSATSSVFITVTNNPSPPRPGPPIVSITSPANGATFNSGVTIPVSASAFETNGSIREVVFVANSNTILGSVTSSPYSVLWTNAPVGTNYLMAVATDVSGISATSVVHIAVLAPVQPPSFIKGPNITIPQNVPSQTFANWATSIDPGAPVGSLSFMVTNDNSGLFLVQPSLASSGTLTFALAANAVGVANLTVVLRSSDGLGSPPSFFTITVVVPRDVAIIRAAADPEIDALSDYLTLDMNLSSQVFDQAGLNADWLQGFKLIIWDDVGQPANTLASNTVDALSAAYSNNIPLYLIGEHLASAAAFLPLVQQSEWSNLTFLSASTGAGGSGSVHITNLNSSYNPILAANFGEVTDFDYPPMLDLATNTQPAAEVFGVSGGADLLIAYPGPDLLQTNFTGTNLFVQNVRVLPPGPAGAVSNLKTLFENTVCWLIQHCTPCPPVAFNLYYENPPQMAQVGQALTLSLTAYNSGDCPSTGVMITNVLPPNARYVSASSMLGTHSFMGDQVVFDIGTLANRQSVQMQITVVPEQAGVITNTAYGGQNGYGTAAPPQIAPGEEVTSILGLSLQRVAPSQLSISLFGQTGIMYEVDSSIDLLHWQPWTNVQGPIWTDLLGVPMQTNFDMQFYRATHQ